MCGHFLSVVYEAAFYWSPDARARRQRGTVQGALARLRDSQRTISQSIEAKRRRIGDFDRNIMEIGLRWRPTAATVAKRPLSANDRAALKHELTRKRLFTRRILRFFELLANVEQQIALLEDSGMLQASATAMRAGAAVHQGLRPDEVERILEAVAEQQEHASDTAQFLQDQAAVTADMCDSDASLEDELASLMENDDFTAQFDPEDIAQAQRAATAPSTPVTDPAIIKMTDMARRTNRDMLPLVDL